MSNPGRVTVWQMIQEAVDNGARTNKDIAQMVTARYPGTKVATLYSQINYCTVNSPSRIHGPENQKIRLARHHLDILFKVDRGIYEPYDPIRHGLWQIIKDDNGRYLIHKQGDLNANSLDSDGLVQPFVESGQFAAEAHLRDYLATNLHVIEEGLTPYVDEYGNGHVEFRTPVGNIDIIALDRDDNLLVVELKVDRSSDAVAGQILRYVNYVRIHVAGNR